MGTEMVASAVPALRMLLAGAESQTIIDTMFTWEASVLFVSFIIIIITWELITTGLAWVTVRFTGRKAIWLRRLKDEILALGIITLVLELIETQILKICISGEDTSGYADGRCPEGQRQMFNAHLIHEVHLLLFQTAVMYIVITTLTFYTSVIRLQMWRPWEKAARYGDNDVNLNEATLMTKLGRNRFIHALRSVWAIVQTGVCQRLYTTIRVLLRLRLDHALAEEGETLLPRSFNFLNFVSQGLEMDFCKSAENAWITFVVMAVFLVIPAFYYPIYFLSGLAIIALLCIAAKLQSIIIHLAAMTFYDFADEIKETNKEHARSYNRISRRSAKQSHELISLSSVGSGASVFSSLSFSALRTTGDGAFRTGSSRGPSLQVGKDTINQPNAHATPSEAATHSLDNRAELMPPMMESSTCTPIPEDESVKPNPNLPAGPALSHRHLTVSTSFSDGNLILNGSLNDHNSNALGSPTGYSELPSNRSTGYSQRISSMNTPTTRSPFTSRFDQMPVGSPVSAPNSMFASNKVHPENTTADGEEKDTGVLTMSYRLKAHFRDPVTGEMLLSQVDRLFWLSSPTLMRWIFQIAYMSISIALSLMVFGMLIDGSLFVDEQGGPWPVALLMLIDVVTLLFAAAVILPTYALVNLAAHGDPKAVMREVQRMKLAAEEFEEGIGGNIWKMCCQHEEHEEHVLNGETIQIFLTLLSNQAGIINAKGNISNGQQLSWLGIFENEKCNDLPLFRNFIKAWRSNMETWRVSISRGEPYELDYTVEGGLDPVYEAFGHIDRDNDGFINKTDLAAIMHALGTRATAEDLQDMVEALDVDNNERICFQEFLLFLIFKFFDYNNDGLLSRHDIHKTLKHMNIEHTTENVERLIDFVMQARVGSDMRRRIQLVEFIHIFFRMKFVSAAPQPQLIPSEPKPEPFSRAHIQFAQELATPLHPPPARTPAHLLSPRRLFSTHGLAADSDDPMQVRSPARTSALKSALHKPKPVDPNPEDPMEDPLKEAAGAQEGSEAAMVSTVPEASSEGGEELPRPSMLRPSSQPPAGSNNGRLMLPQGGEIIGGNITSAGPSSKSKIPPDLVIDDA